MRLGQASGLLDSRGTVVLHIKEELSKNVIPCYDFTNMDIGTRGEESHEGICATLPFRCLVLLCRAMLAGIYRIYSAKNLH